MGWETGHGAAGYRGRGWLGQGCALLQYHLLPRHYQFLLVTAFLILSLAEGSRLYLGYVGNLQEKVSAISLPWPQAPCARCGLALQGAAAVLDARNLSACHRLFLLELSWEGTLGAGKEGDPLAVLLYPSHAAV